MSFQVLRNLSTNYMSKSLSINIEDADLRTLEAAANGMSVGRDAVIAHAIRFYARYLSRQKLREQYRIDSAIVAEESMRVLREFEALG